MINGNQLKNYQLSDNHKPKFQKKLSEKNLYSKRNKLASGDNLNSFNYKSKPNAIPKNDNSFSDDDLYNDKDLGNFFVNNKISSFNQESSQDHLRNGIVGTNKTAFRIKNKDIRPSRQVTNSEANV